MFGTIRACATIIKRPVRFFLRSSQQAKCYRELRQRLRDSNLFVVIAFMQLQSFSGKHVPILFGATAERKQNVSILPDSGPDWGNIPIIEQSRHQAWDNHEKG